MSKQKVRVKKTGGKIQEASPAPQRVSKSFGRGLWWPGYLLVFLFSLLLYSNTAWNKYALDDAMVLTNNKFTKRGIAGIKDQFTHDMMEGLFGEKGSRLISGGRYRPLSAVSFSIEYEVMRRLKGDPRVDINNRNIILGDKDPYLNPALSHAINALLFALICLVLYYLLQKIIPDKYSIPSPFGNIGLPLIVAMLYAAHPIHTEAVAYIKGRDEILCMFFSLLALTAAISYVQTQKILHLAWGALVFFAALLSKENAVTFLAIIPLTCYFFTKAGSKSYATILVAYFIPLLLFLALRSHYTQKGVFEDSQDILNNPFLHATAGERFATTILTFWYYIKLLIFPHPLTCDYYYNQIPYVNITNIFFLFSLLINTGLLVYAILNLRKKGILSYAILFYFITFSIVSNLFFTVGVLMNERFLFMSSLGYCLALGYLLARSKENLKLSATFAFPLLIFILSLYLIKTFSRNFDWKDQRTLFTGDIRWSPGSALLQRYLAGQYLDLARKQTEPALQNEYLDSCLVHINESLRIYPSNPPALLDLGNALYNKYHKAEQVIPVFEKVIATTFGGSYDGNVVLGKLYYKENQPQVAKKYLMSAMSLSPDESEPENLLAAVYAKLNQPDSVEYWLKAGNALKPVEGNDYYEVCAGFMQMGNNMPKGIEYLQKAIELEPRNSMYWQNLGEAYAVLGKFPEAVEATKKILDFNPDYALAYRNLAMFYNSMGDKSLSEQNQAKYRQLQSETKINR